MNKVLHIHHASPHLRQTKGKFKKQNQNREEKTFDGTNDESACLKINYSLAI
jgi:hypothetical protein